MLQLVYVRPEGEPLIIPADLKQTFENKFTLNIGKNEIVKMKNNNVITDRDLAIAKFLFRFKFATADQISRLVSTGDKVVNMRNRLDKLVKYRVLNKFMLSYVESDRFQEGAEGFYCLDLGGKYLLSHYSNEDTSDWYTTVNMKTSEIISKDIFVTEFFLRLMKTCPKKITHFQSNPELRIGKKNLYPSFEMRMTVNGQNRYFIGEVFREYDFPAQARERILKLETLLTTNTWKKYYYEGERPPILFAFADSDLTALEVGKAITEMSEIRNFRISTDERIGRELYESGAFLKYIEEKDVLQEIRATTFKPD